MCIYTLLCYITLIAESAAPIYPDFHRAEEMAVEIIELAEPWTTKFGSGHGKLSCPSGETVGLIESFSSIKLGNY